jgi:hypothetical protein
MKLYFNKSKIKFLLSIDKLYSEKCIKGAEYKDQTVILISVSPCISTIQQYLLQQIHDLILFSVNLAHMFRLIRPSSGQQSLEIPSIQFVKQTTNIKISVLCGHV